MFNSYNEIVHWRNEKCYVIKHWSQIICCLILTLRYLLAIGSYLWNNPSFQYWHYDPLILYLKINFAETYIIYVIIIMTPAIISIFIIYPIYLHPFNIYVSQIFYDLIVLNFEQLNQCLVKPRDEQELFAIDYECNLTKLKTMVGVLWNFRILKFILKRCCLVWTKNLFQLNPKMIHHKKLLKFKLKTAPIISLKCRLGLAKMMIIQDITYYIFHIYGKLLNCS